MTPEVLDQLLLTAPPAIPDEQQPQERIVFQKCPYCKRRPTFMVTNHITVATGLEAVYPQEAEFIQAEVEIPTYEVIPCCSAKYVHTIEHITRRQRLNAQNQRN